MSILLGLAGALILTVALGGVSYGYGSHAARKLPAGVRGRASRVAAAGRHRAARAAGKARGHAPARARASVRGAGSRAAAGLRAGYERILVPRAGVSPALAAAGPRPVPVPASAAPSPSPPPSGRNTTPMTIPVTRPAHNGSGVSADMLAGVQAVANHARKGGIRSKHRAAATLAEGFDYQAQVLEQLARELSEPSNGYPPQVWESLSAAAAHLKAAGSSAGESASMLTSIMGTTVGELAGSSVRAPHHDELNADD